MIESYDVALTAIAAGLGLGASFVWGYYVGRKDRISK
jgi:hypothetical protein